MKEFSFQINMPRRELDVDSSYQDFKILAEYPHYVYSVRLKPNEPMAEAEQIKLAISELKIRLIKDIACAEFIVTKD